MIPPSVNRGKFYEALRNLRISSARSLLTPNRVTAAPADFFVSQCFCSDKYSRAALTLLRLCCAVRADNQNLWMPSNVSFASGCSITWMSISRISNEDSSCDASLFKASTCFLYLKYASQNRHQRDSFAKCCFQREFFFATVALRRQGRSAMRGADEYLATNFYAYCVRRM